MNQPLTLTNFGHNVSISPEQYFEPRSEQEVLAILADCRGKRIRVIGRLHSWSPVIEADQVLINLQYLNEVVVEEREEGVWATVGGGCQIKRLLADLLCRSMGKLFQARPHWGKVCPLTNIEAEQLYDNLALFRDTMVQSDPQGTFRNDWLDKTVFAESLDPN